MEKKSIKRSRVVWVSASILAFIFFVYRPYISLTELYSSIAFQIDEIELEVFTTGELSFEDEGFVDILRFGNPFRVTVRATTESSKYRSIRIEKLSLEPIGDRQGALLEWEDMQIQVFVLPVYSSEYRAAQSVYRVDLGNVDYKIDLTIEVCEAMGCESYEKSGELIYGRDFQSRSKLGDELFD